MRRLVYYHWPTSRGFSQPLRLKRVATSRFTILPLGPAPVKAMSCSGAETVSPLLPLRYKMVQVSQFRARPCSGKQHTREVLYQCDRCFGTRHFVCVWRGCLFVVCSAGYAFRDTLRVGGVALVAYAVCVVCPSFPVKGPAAQSV